MRIAIIDDEEAICDSIRMICAREGHEAAVFTAPGPFLKNIAENAHDLVFLDINLGKGVINGLDVLKKIMADSPGLRVVIISGNADIHDAVTAMKIGARDFLEKPLHIEDILRLLQDAALDAQIREERDHFLNEVLGAYTIFGESEKIRIMKSEIDRFADLNEPVLITGESGTGKELVAAQLHYLSERRGNKPVKVNIASLQETLIESQLFGYRKGAFSGAESDQEGLFVRAANSTLFLDEIGELGMHLQPKLLRAIQEKEVLPVGSTEPVPVSARLITATNRDLVREAEEGSFRSDLYYRISTLRIDVPPLRERRNDIPQLARVFIRTISEDNNLPCHDLSPGALDRLVNYSFPGNVRELKNILLKTMVAKQGGQIIEADEIVLEEKSSSGKGNDSLLEAVFNEEASLTFKKKQLEKMYIERQLALNRGDVKLTAESLGILPNNLYRKIKELEI